MNAPGRDSASDSNRGRPAAKRGVARPLSPEYRGSERIDGRVEHSYQVRYVDQKGRRPRGDIFQRPSKTAARRAAEHETDRVVDELNLRTSSRHRLGYEITLRQFHATYAERYPAWKRTVDTDVWRVGKHILPYLPDQGDFPLADLRRDMLRDVQAQLLRQRLAKRTIDHAFSSLSALLKRAEEDEIIEVNIARGFRVDRRNPLLNPTRARRDRRFVPPAEVRHFIAHAAPQWQAVCWTPVLTGVRAGELFALQRTRIDRQQYVIDVRETADNRGRITAGTKTDHHDEPSLQGRTTLLPAALIEILDAQPASVTGLLYPTPTGKVWQESNFRRDVWKPARDAAGVDVTPQDLRHTWISWLMAVGVPLPEISAWAGHQLVPREFRPNTTVQVYAHDTGYWRKFALEQLTAFMAAPLHQLERQVAQAHEYGPMIPAR